MVRFNDSELSLSGTERYGSYHRSAGAGHSTKRKREATPERRENIAPKKTLSMRDVGCTQSPLHKVKLGRDCLLDVEHAPDWLKTVARQNQRSSPFLRLSWDIKLKIYKLAIGGLHIHIDHGRFKEHISDGLYCEVNSEGDSEEADVFMASRRGLPIIARTCRQIYHDTALF